MASTQGKLNGMGCSKKADMAGGSRSKKGPSPVDWQILRDEWVTTNISLSELGKKYDVPFFQVRKHYLRERWMDKLAEFNQMVENAVYEAKMKKAKALAERINDLDEMVLATSERVIEVVAEQIESALGKVDKRITARDIISVMKQASETIKNAHYNIRLSGDKATNIVDNRTEVIDSDEEDRLRNEFGFITRKTKVISTRQILGEES